MKTATFPSLRVTAEFRQAAEQVLLEGESLSSFVEESIRENIALAVQATRGFMKPMSMAEQQELADRGEQHRNDGHPGCFDEHAVVPPSRPHRPARGVFCRIRGACTFAGPSGGSG